MIALDRCHTTFASDAGPLTLVATDGVLTHLYMREQKYRLPVEQMGRHVDAAVFREPRRQLLAYFAGDLTRFELAYTLVGTEFQRACWAALEQIPYGETRTYSDVAAVIGQPAAVRAVGVANGRNPLGVIVPCHRVIGSDGSLTGYGGGLERKRQLLDLEAGRSEYALFPTEEYLSDGYQ